MATNRKLQAEIDRVLKRVAEGMEEFDQIWEKVHTAATPNLKEKYETDLKKEIKKLQRYRDSIKSWVSSSEVKNKTPLLEARKNIESEMERFKVLEKETKTKAYSRSGLSLVTKKKTDPRADPKYETIAWIRKAVRDLKSQIETMQKASANAKVVKKSKPKAKGGEAEESQVNWIERHQWQIEQLSKTKRRLEKGEVTITQVQEIKDDVGYYIESNQNPDFYEDELLYNALDEAAAENGALDDDYEVDPDFDTEDDFSEEEEDQESYEATPKQLAQSEDITSPVPALVVPPPTTTLAAPAPAKSGTKTPPPNSIIGSLSSVNSAAATVTTPVLAPVTPTPAKSAGVPPMTVPPATTAPAAKVTPRAAPTPTPVPVRPTAPTPTAVAAAVAATARPAMPKATPTPSQSTPPLTTPTAAPAQAQVPRAPLVKGTRTGSSGPPSPTAAAIHLPPNQPSAPQSQPPYNQPPSQLLIQQQMQQQLQLQFQQFQLQRDPSQPAPTTPQSLTPSAPPNQPLLPPQAQLSSQSHPAHPQQPQPPTASQITPPHLQPLRQMDHPQNSPQLQHPAAAGQRHPQAPGGPTQPQQQQQQPPSLPPVPPQPQSSSQLRAVVDEDYLYNLKMLEPSLRNTPDPRDSERPKQYAPRNPYRTPPYFPSVPATVFDDPAIFEKFSTDTLFFIFYFQQGTPHQYLAARELKKQSWRYHKNFLTWFQRHDEPKLSTEEYEQGAYVYFDYESGWSTSIKTDFTFEYRHLEDELWVPTNASV